MISMVPYHLPLYIFLQDFTEVFYHFQIEPTLTWLFTASYICQAYVNP